MKIKRRTEKHDREPVSQGERPHSLIMISIFNQRGSLIPHCFEDVVDS